MVISLEAKFTSCPCGFMDCPVGWKGQGEVSGIGFWGGINGLAHFSSFSLPFWKYGSENSE